MKIERSALVKHSAMEMYGLVADVPSYAQFLSWCTASEVHEQDKDVQTMRAIAEEAFDLVRRYKGSHSGEHGDGIVRSEFHEAMFGSRMVRNFEEVKDLLDPDGLFNPGKIVRPPLMDDRTLFRFKPGYAARQMDTALDWYQQRDRRFGV